MSQHDEPDPPTAPPSKQIGKLPALGWNTWNAYHGDIDEAKILAAASSFISLGLKDAGYEYINIDDRWALMYRDPEGRMIPDPAKFPNGIASIADRVHGLGLKFGLYSDAGTRTCAGYPGSLGHELTDAQTFADWGIDYLKYDNCAVPIDWKDDSKHTDGDWYNSKSAIRYRRMAVALATLSRPIEYNLCIWGTAEVWTWGARVGHSWRIAYDSKPCWSYFMHTICANLKHLDAVDFFAHNDMDMMEIGNGKLTIEEERTHFAAWAFLKSPILLGTDLRKLSREQIAIITNKELLAFHQDSTIGAPAMPFTPFTGAPSTEPPEYYSGKSVKGSHVFIINTSPLMATKEFKFSNVPGLNTSGEFKIHDMWTGAHISGTFNAASTFTVAVGGHDTVAYLISEA